jgi:hypothetical protein
VATLVKFIGGPFAGQAEGDSDPLRGSGAAMAEMAFHDYSAHPPAAGVSKWVLCRVHTGRTPGPHFYKIVSGETRAGRLELVCEYGGTQYPVDDIHRAQ